MADRWVVEIDGRRSAYTTASEFEQKIAKGAKTGMHPPTAVCILNWVSSLSILTDLSAFL
jgi:hypothetical protein